VRLPSIHPHRFNSPEAPCDSSPQSDCRLPVRDPKRACLFPQPAQRAAPLVYTLATIRPWFLMIQPPLLPHFTFHRIPPENKSSEVPLRCFSDKETLYFSHTKCACDFLTGFPPAKNCVFAYLALVVTRSGTSFNSSRSAYPL